MRVIPPVSMIIDRLNLNQLRIFEAVYRTKSMTRAAKELHLTQSGISQHMKSLEDILQVPLFDRVKQKLVPTSSAHSLYKKCVDGLYGIEQALTDISGNQAELSGRISIGMPIEFGNNLIMPKLAEFAQRYPRVNLELRMGFATEMSAGLLDGSIDFAFVDEFHLDKRVVTRRVYDEVLLLCASPKYLESFKSVSETKKFFESLDYIDYQPDAPVTQMWLKRRLGPSAPAIRVRAVVMDVQAVSRLILAGLGAGVLPAHLVRKLEGDQQKIHLFGKAGRGVTNTISVAQLSQKTFLPAAEKLLQELMQHLADLEKARIATGISSERRLKL